MTPGETALLDQYEMELKATAKKEQRDSDLGLFIMMLILGPVSACSFFIGLMYIAGNGHITW